MKDNAKPMKGIRIQILALLARKPDLTVADMIDSLSDFTEKQIGDNCYQAKQDGLLTSRMDGITRKQAYSITDQGKARIKDSLTTEPTKPVVKPNLTTKPVKRNPFQPQGADIAELRKLVDDGAKENARLHADLTAANQTIWSMGQVALKESKNIADLMRENSILRGEVSGRDEVIALKDQDHKAATDALSRKCAELDSLRNEPASGHQVTVEQFMVRIPKYKPFVVKSLDKARQQAMRAAKITGKAEVFALVPVGDAVRGAVWNQK